MNKLKNMFGACFSFYCKIRNVFFYLLLLAIILLSGFIYSTVKEYKEKKAVAETPLPPVSVQEEEFKKTPLYTHLEQRGFARLQIAEIIKKLDGIMHTRKLRAQDSYMLFTEPDGGFKMLVVTRDLSRYFVAAVNDELVAGIIDIEVKTRQKQASGTIESSLFTAMQKSGIMVPLIVAFTDVFSWNIDFNTETRKGDAYTVIWEEDYTPGENGMVVDQRILAAKYKGEQAGENYAFNFDGDFYDETGQVSQRLFLKSPISFQGARITSRFSLSRMHPIHRIRRPHLGIDYAAPVGTPVEAVADGVVKFAGVKGGFGNYIEIAHANNFTTCYGHLKSFNVKTGEKVKQGKVVGYVGSSGTSTGPHLDFRIREGQKYQDFLRMKNRNSSIRKVPEDKKEEFEKTVEKYKKQLNEKAEL